MRRSTITLLSLLAVVCVVYASPAREAAHRQSFSQFEIQRQTEQTTISLQLRNCSGLFSRWKTALSSMLKFLTAGCSSGRIFP